MAVACGESSKSQRYKEKVSWKRWFIEDHLEWVVLRPVPEVPLCLLATFEGDISG